MAVYWVSQRKGLAGGEAIIILSALGLRLLLWQQDPILSNDLARYTWEAELWNSGGNPYLSTPRELGANPLAVPGPDDRAVYGPWLMLVQWGSWKLGSTKLSGALGELLLLCAVWHWTRKQRLPWWRFAAYAWCPLVSVEFWREGHGDGWLALLAFCGMASLANSSRFAAWLLIGLSVLTKWWPVLYLPWLIRRAWSAAGLLLWILSAASLLLLPGWSFWEERIRFTTGFLGGWSNNAFLAHLFASKWQAVSVILLVAATLPIWKTTPMRTALYFSSALLAFSANIHPWYFIWFLPFACVAAAEVSPWLLACALSPLFFEPVVAWRVLGVWREDTGLRMAIWLAIALYALFRALRRRIPLQ